MTRIALDLDSTLANTSSIAFDLLAGPDHDYTMDDIEDWTWGFREFGKEAYLNALWHAWTIRGDQIPPLEDDIVETVTELNRFGTVDIVTAHPDHFGITKAKREWVDDLGIPYNEFHTTGTNTTKANLGYDIYIDDKPELPSQAFHDQLVYLYDQRYNQDADGEYTRVESLDEVIEHEQERQRVTV